MSGAKISSEIISDGLVVKKPAEPPPGSACMAACKCASLGLQDISHQGFCNFTAIMCVAIVSVGLIICINGTRKFPKHMNGPSLHNTILCNQNWTPASFILHKLPMTPFNNTLSILFIIHSKSEKYPIIHHTTNKR